MNTILTVSQINTYIKSIIDYDDNLNNIYVCGEISNFTDHYRTGHFYFTLKDEKSSVKAVMFRQNAQLLKFEPYNGLKVLIRGRVSVFERDGAYQLYVTDMQPDGLGELNLAFEQLKEKLSGEGLFDDIHKKPLPSTPNKIAVITSPTGAAVQDILNVISRRYPCCEIIIVPVQVQGVSSASQIVAALETVNSLNAADVIILARGGGSIEDLWSFNEEIVARAVFRSKIPVISGVGHETDFTICDFVSDKRAPTPSAAAEIAVPDIRNIYSGLEYYIELLKSSLYEKLMSYEIRLDELSQILEMTSPLSKIKEKRTLVYGFEKYLNGCFLSLLNSRKQQLCYLSGSLEALSPLKTISRGFSLVFDENDNHVSSAKRISAGDKIKIKMKDGSVMCTVDEANR